MSKALFNFNLPAGGGKLTPGKVLGVMAAFGVGMAAWNWGSKAPVVGKYINYAEGYTLKALGFNVPTPTL